MIIETAKSEIGMVKNKKESKKYEDEILSNLVDGKHYLEMQIRQGQGSEEEKKYKNWLRDLVRKCIKELEEGKSDKIIEQIESTQNSSKMFNAARHLKLTKANNTISVHNENGENVGNDEDKAEEIAKWYQQYY